MAEINMSKAVSFLKGAEGPYASIWWMNNHVLKLKCLNTVSKCLRYARLNTIRACSTGVQR